MRSRIDGHGGGAGARLQSRTEADSDAVAAITKLENDAIKAVLANDSSFFEKFLANDFTGGTSRGTWDTKPSTLADMKDVKNNKTTSQNLTDLKVRVHGDLAIATYSSTYDAMIRKAVRQNSPVHGRAPTAERRLEADGEPLFSSRQIGISEPRGAGLSRRWVRSRPSYSSSRVPPPRKAGS